MNNPCKYGDPSCPCQDGDMCHYEGPNAWTKPYHLCLVCGYDMQEPAADYNICPSCGTEWDLDDQNASIAELRAAWIDSGACWWSQSDPMPVGWNPQSQLLKVLFAE